MNIEAGKLDGRNIGSVIEFQKSTGTMYATIESFFRDRETEEVTLCLSGDATVVLPFTTTVTTRRTNEAAQLSQLRDAVEDMADYMEERDNKLQVIQADLTADACDDYRSMLDPYASAVAVNV